MVKLVIKLAVVALIANAGYRIGSEYLTFIKFRDEVRDAAMFKAQTDEELEADIMALAGKYDVPLEPTALTIQRAVRQVNVDGHYVKPVEIAPSYFYPWTFDFSLQANVSFVVQPYPTRPR